MSSSSSNRRPYALRRSQRSMNLNQETFFPPSSTSTNASPFYSPQSPSAASSSSTARPSLHSSPFSHPSQNTSTMKRSYLPPSTVSPFAQTAVPSVSDSSTTLASTSTSSPFSLSSPYKFSGSAPKRTYFSSSLAKGASSPPPPSLLSSPANLSPSSPPFLSPYRTPYTPAQKLRKKDPFSSIKHPSNMSASSRPSSFSPFATSSPQFVSTSTPGATAAAPPPPRFPSHSQHLPSSSSSSSFFFPSSHAFTSPQKSPHRFSFRPASSSATHSPPVSLPTPKRPTPRSSSFLFGNSNPAPTPFSSLKHNDSPNFHNQSRDSSSHTDSNSSFNSTSTLFPNATLPIPNPSHNLFTTPFQQVKPSSQAFLSTGLLSKQSRPRKTFNLSTPLPPSTPSKPSSIFRPNINSADSPPSPSTPSNSNSASFFLQGQSTPTHQSSFSSAKLGKSSMDFLRFEPPSSTVKQPPDSQLIDPSTPTRNPFDFENSSMCLDDIHSSAQHRNNCEILAEMEEESAILGNPSIANSNLSFPSALTSKSPESPADDLHNRFRNITLLGRGEFSEVFQVEDPLERSLKYAVKKLKVKYSGPKERNRLLHEVSVQRALKGHDHIVELIDSWEFNGYLFMQVELCENGSLDRFLEEQGQLSRLDEFRVWKILVELALGLQYIHHKNFVHLDLKPANVMITFEGTLKIGDFGMASVWPVPRGMEREGDCEYIAPEILSNHMYDKPADIFSLGITVFEAAANIVLPDNGQSWQKLRSGDLSDAPRLSSTEGSSNTSSSRDVPLNSIIGQGGLDRVVQWMLAPEPRNRPTVDQILATPEVSWIELRRKAGAIIYEGLHGSSSAPQSDQMMEDWQVNV
ncbi:WEE protein kinase Wee1 [Schizosaccharomyces cryophilus OY26]|uniref:WEE protein kinase Wee1 n=1 Tax=Schizosaccharomyces cryophilus (strain OY26 / ATCC MYA-4695 / CBS 11777 / NBRC 106824 / NRRL Y48691) TaxID=653667 RepID=S9X810_SCHCR|nr:WEE protein kinase Wee1 [Schizosaccharomyces cryophilus OY26]EPY49856.1 WEE protein kinase Wee1 [Schizosaccharomyces cryophilus OY26]